MLRRKPNLASSICLLLVLLLFSACQKTALYHNLSEEEANEIMVVLYSAGIEVEKEQEVVQNETFWTILVEKKDLPEARRLLVERNLPRERELGLSGVYKDKGLIPTPDEQKARFLLAVKGEIINSLERIPEVVDADVIINVPTPEEFGRDEDKRPTASVVLKVRPEGEIISQLTEAKIQRFVANSVEDLNPRDVSVIISYIAQPNEIKSLPDKLKLSSPSVQQEAGGIEGLVSIAGVSVKIDSARRLKIYLFIFFAVLLVMSAVLVVTVVRTSRMKQEYTALLEGPERPLIEGQVAETEEEVNE